ncbi:zinc finger CCCH domain-containing protein 66-like [Cynara cardunculus var. scolymus]|uniref:zinc finger CCCH domain-containing protein 66-like n=1 Tax=Cynara cardunculus var. scolymus TaxID=59895 RepID=UPI000D62BB87|nr:zinc finger CCCH domain-containing protein 66-like [Cynara cardunculus var. scolymus]
MATSGDDGIKKKFFLDLKCLFSQIPEVDTVLKSNQSDTYSDESKVVLLDGDDDGFRNSNLLHPIRPNAKDCSFFLRTGTCKFGTTCIFNHPVLSENSVDLGKSNENGVESSYRNSCPIPCKFYLSGHCKYGDFCKFNHCKSEAEKSTGQLNVYGFPKRLGKKNCAFYMRTGMCGYGESCRFHHPDPFFIMPELYSSVVTGESMDDHKETSEITLHFSESTPSHLSRPLITPKSLAYVHQNFVLSGNQGKKVCWNYERVGLCKFGHACAYDHPNKHSPKDGSTSEFPSGEAYPYNILPKGCC